MWALATLYAAPLGEHLVFKGGTSLSKVHRVIDRFSEDIDLTYDIRRLVDAAKSTKAFTTRLEASGKARAFSIACVVLSPSR